MKSLKTKPSALSLRFNGDFSRWSAGFIEAKDDKGQKGGWAPTQRTSVSMRNLLLLLLLRMMEVVVATAGDISRAKLESKCHHQQTHTQLFTDWMLFLSPNQQCQSTEGENITFHGLAHSKLTWGLSTLSLTTNSSWLPWELVKKQKNIWKHYPPVNAGGWLREGTRSIVYTVHSPRTHGK